MDIIYFYLVCAFYSLYPLYEMFKMVYFYLYLAFYSLYPLYEIACQVLVELSMVNLFIDLFLYSFYPVYTWFWMLLMEFEVISLFIDLFLYSFYPIYEFGLAVLFEFKVVYLLFCILLSPVSDVFDFIPCVQDLPFVYYFCEEIILFVGTNLLLIFSCFAKARTQDFSVNQRKKYFILVLGLVKLLLVSVLLIGVLKHSVFNAIYSSVEIDILYDFSFKFDFWTYSFLTLLTVLALFYIGLVFLTFLVPRKTFLYFIETPFIILFGLLNVRLLLLANDLVVILLCLEAISFCAIIFIGMQSATKMVNVLPVESSLKYFVYNGFSLGFLLFGLTGLFFFFGSTNLVTIASTFLMLFSDYTLFYDSVIFVSFLFLFGFFIKLGVFPFHFWVPDVYEGAELIVTTFLVLFIAPALLFKSFIFLKIFIVNFEISRFSMFYLLFTGFGSLVVGTFGAFFQTRVKRFIAYTGISHIGYILIALSSGHILGFFSSLFYLLIYILTNVSFFSLLVYIKFVTYNKVFNYFNQFQALFRQNLHFLIFFVIIFLSFAGFPPFAGFFSKLGVLIALRANLMEPVFVLLFVFLVINAYLYLRFLKITCFEKNGDSSIFYVVGQNSEVSIPKTKLRFMRLFFVERFVQFKTNFALLLNVNFILGLFFTFAAFVLPIILQFVWQLILTLWVLY